MKKIFILARKGNKIDITNPSDVTGLTKGTVTNNAIPLSWDAASDDTGVTNYEIYESINGGAYNLKLTLGNVLVYPNTDLDENTLYAYKMKAKDAAGNTSTNFSNIVTATTLYDDQIPPILNSITVEDANPNNVVMVFNEAVTGTNLGFTLSSVAFVSLSGSGTTWTGVMVVAVEYGDIKTLSYDSVAGDFKDSSNNDLASITNQEVTNNVLWSAPSGTLIANGGFDTDTDWDLQNGTTITGGEAIVNTTANYAIALRQLEPVGMVETSSYTVKFKITNYVSGDLICAIGTTANDKTPLINANGEYTFVLERQTGALDRLIFNTSGNGAVMNLDNISLVEN